PLLLLACGFAGPQRLAPGRQGALRAPARLADPAAVLGGAGLQLAGGVVRDAAAGHACPDREVGAGTWTAAAGHRRLTLAQRRVLVDRDRGAAVPGLPAVAVAAAPGERGRHGGRGAGGCRRGRDAGTTRVPCGRSDAADPAVRGALRVGHG